MAGREWTAEEIKEPLGVGTEGGGRSKLTPKEVAKGPPTAPDVSSVSPGHSQSPTSNEYINDLRFLRKTLLAFLNHPGQV